VNAVLGSVHLIIHQTNDWGGNALISAVDSNDISVLGALIDMEMDVDHQINSGLTALHRIANQSFAIPDEQSTMVKLLSLAGANINKPDNQGNTPLHLAAKRGNNHVVKSLYKLGASLNLRNKDGKTPLDIAKEHGKIETLNLLILLK
jgi:ankyrin repeat protein